MSLSVVPAMDISRLEEWKSKGDVTTVNGVELFSIAATNFGNMNNSSKPNLIVVHGFPTASFDFWKIHEKLQEHFEAFLWDFAGFGFSQKVYRTISEQIDLLQALLQQKGFCSPRQQQQGGTNENASNRSNDDKLKTHILSHDLGDTLVQEMLARDGNLCFSIQSIVMLNGGILPKMHRPTLAQHALLIPGLNVVASYLFQSLPLFKWSISKVFGPHTQPTDQEIHEFYTLVVCNGGEKLITENIKYMTERQVHHDRWVHALKSFAAATEPRSGRFCLINGPADPVSGRHLAQAVIDQVQCAKVVFLEEHIGHWPQIEAPEETMNAFLIFHKEIGTIV